MGSHKYLCRGHCGCHGARYSNSAGYLHWAYQYVRRKAVYLWKLIKLLYKADVCMGRPYLVADLAPVIPEMEGIYKY